MGKSLVNVQRTKGNEEVWNPHRPFRNVCTGTRSPDCSDTSLRIQHYSGTLQTHASRFGRDMEAFLRKNNFTASLEEDWSVHNWLHRFVELMGNSSRVAWELTQGLREEAYLESMSIRERLDRNESVPRLYQWDSPVVS